MYKRVPTLGLLLIIQGILEGFVGILYTVMGPALMTFMETAPVLRAASLTLRA